MERQSGVWRAVAVDGTIPQPIARLRTSAAFLGLPTAAVVGFTVAVAPGDGARGERAANHCLSEARART